MKLWLELSDNFTNATFKKQGKFNLIKIWRVWCGDMYIGSIQKKEEPLGYVYTYNLAIVYRPGEYVRVGDKMVLNRELPLTHEKYDSLKEAQVALKIDLETKLNYIWQS